MHVTQTYVEGQAEAQDAIRSIVARVSRMSRTSAEIVLGIDTETAPHAALTGYPGSQIDAEGNPVKADRRAYYEYAQKLFAYHYNPDKLRAFGIFVPDKTTPSAAPAWAEVLAAVERADLASAQWTRADLGDHITRAETAVRELEAQMKANAEIDPEKRKKKDDSQLKKLKKLLDEENQRLAYLYEAERRLEEGIELPPAILPHILRIAVEKRTYTNKNGRNKFDAVQPGLDPFTTDIFLFQLTLVDGDEQFDYIFNCFSFDNALLLPLLQFEKALYVGANIKFDLKLFMHHLGFAPQNVWCTAVADRILYLGLGLPTNLEAVAKRYLGVQLDKKVRETFIGVRYERPTPDQVAYSYMDTHILPAIQRKQLAKARNAGQEEIVRVFSKLSWIAAHWEVQGYRIDIDKWLELAAQSAQARDDAAQQIEEILLPKGYARLLGGSEVQSNAYAAEQEEDMGDEAEEDGRKNAVIKISQGAVVKELASRVLGMPLTSLDRINRENVEREYRRKHHGQSHPFFKLYATWSKRAKQASTYGAKFLWYIHPLTGKIHPVFTVAGTDTGRFTSNAPNFLNIPAAKDEGDPDYRSAFIAEEGHYLLGADYDTMEFRIAGDLAREPMLKAMVEKGVDAHTVTAFSMFHLELGPVTAPTKKRGVYTRGANQYDIDVWELPSSWTIEQVADFATGPEAAEAVLQVKKDYGAAVTRTDAKAVTFLWLFRGTPFTLALRTGLPVDFCEGLFERFARTYSKMDRFMLEEAEAVHTRFIEGKDGVRYAYATGYAGIRRYAELPHNPHQGEFPSYREYLDAAKQYKRELGRIQRQLANIAMQGGNAVITAMALISIVERGQHIGVLPFLSIYDENLVSAPDSVPPEVTKELLEWAMLSNAKRFMTYVQPGAEADIEKGVSRHWKKS